MTQEAPFFDDLAEAPAGGSVFWVDAGGARVRAAVWPGGARGAVFLCSGRTEYIEKYGRVIGDLTARGFSVVTCDWRGQGLSDRALADPMKGHVGDFAEYQRDVEAVLASPEAAAVGPPRVMICHSMGGAIGLRALVDGRVAPEAVIFSAPMFGLTLSPALRLVTPALVWAANAFGLGERYTPDNRPEVGYVSKAPFDDNLLTGDREEWDRMGAALAAQPALGLGAPTWAWLKAARAEMAALERAKAPGAPSLMLLGERERIVSPEAIRAYARRAAAAEVMEIPGGQHEGFMETPAIRQAIWERIDGFMAKALEEAAT